MRLKRLNAILIISGISLAIIYVSLNWQPQRSYDVRVINGFRDNSSLPLVIWCSSSGEGEMGGRALQEGDDFGWRVRTSLLWGTNKYVCTMKWDERRRKFDAFVLGRDANRCGPLRKCSWLVREDGFFFSNDEVNWRKEFSWF